MLADSLPTGTLVAGRYRIVRELGRGAMGAVYVVEHVNTGGQSALKVLLDTHLVAERAARFRREARASARIQSEHVVRVTDADTAPELGGAPFLVMELLSGEDLEHRLKDSGPLSPREVVHALTEVGRGLEKAHAVGVIHRDLKPENIFLHRREDGGIIYKVLDFGISKLLRPETDPGALSATGSADVMGTPLYMAPEQAAAWHDKVGPATDVCALGLMAHRMLTGASYWQGQSVPQVFAEIMSHDRIAPSVRFPSLPLAFDAWFAKSCAFEASDRFQSVAEQVAALELALDPDRPSIAKAVAVSESPLQLATQIMPRATPDLSPGNGLAMITSTASPLSRSSPPPAPVSQRLARATLVGLVVLVVSILVGAVLVFREERRAAARSAPSSASAGDGRAPQLLPPRDTSRTDSVALSTPDALVQVDGKSVAVTNGRFDVTGNLGSVHDVQLRVGSAEQTARIVMAESGPIPSAIGLALPPTSAKPVAPTQQAPRGGARPGAAAAAASRPASPIIQPLPGPAPHPSTSPEPAAKCDPPYTIDSAGHHVLKAGCE